MGTDPARPDIETVADYANGNRFIRLHLDIHVDNEVYNSFREMMDKGDRSSALTLLKSHAYDASPYLELFFNPPVMHLRHAAE